MSCLPGDEQLARLCERPAIVGREFDPVLAWIALLMAERAEAQFAAMEEVFPAIAEIHRRDKICLQAVLTGAVRHLHALKTDHRLGVLAGLQGIASMGVQLETIAGQHHMRTADRRHFCIDTIVAAHELRRVERARRAVEFSGRALLFNAPVAQQQDAVRHRHRFGLVMRHSKSGQPQRHDQFPQPRARFFAQLGVEVGERLIEQDHRRVVDKRTRNRHALLLTTR